MNLDHKPESTLSARAGVPIAKTSTGIQGLDEILMGGLPSGRTTLINGGPGTGKTILAVEFLYKGALAGEPSLFVTFEERADDLSINAGSMGWDLAGLEQEGKLRVMQAKVPFQAVRTGEFTIKGLISIIEGHLHALGAERLVLDALDVLLRIFGDSERQREEILVLHQWLTERRLTTLLSVKTDLAGRSIYPFMDYISDCVLCLDQRITNQIRTRRLQVIKYRGSNFHNNEYPYVISPEGLVFMPISALTLADDGIGEMVSSGLPELDRLLGGGIMQGACLLIGGPSGSGKSILSGTFARAACERNERVLYISFEESQGSLLKGMCHAGVDLRGVIDQGRLKMLSVLPESKGFEQHLLDIAEIIRQHKPVHLIVDAISATKRVGPEQATFEFLLRLLNHCKKRSITCLFTNQTLKEDQVTEISGVGISSLVDTSISLQLLDDGTGLHRRLLIIKSRGAKHSLKYHAMHITDHGVNIDEKPDRT